MNFGTQLRLSSRFKKFEQDLNELTELGIIDSGKSLNVADEFKQCKKEYKRLSKVYDEEAAIVLLKRMRNMPTLSDFKFFGERKQEIFAIKIEEWIKTL